MSMISPSADQSDACNKKTRNGSPNRSGARGSMPAEFFTAIHERWIAEQEKRGLRRGMPERKPGDPDGGGETSASE